MIVVHDPRGGRVAASPTLATRPSSLAGLRLGILDNGKEKADALLGRTAELLERDGVNVTFARKRRRRRSRRSRCATSW
jgi:hypothetical protein